MPEADVARVDECDRSIPRRETSRGTHWQKTPCGCLELASRNPSWQRSSATATTDRTYDRKRSDAHEQTLATRGPSTYGSRPSPGRRSVWGAFAPDALLSISIFKQRANPCRHSGAMRSIEPGMTESGSLRSSQ